MSDAVKWPNGYSDFYYKVRLNAEKIRAGTILALDPASGGSSLPGFAIYYAGVLQSSGVIPVTKKTSIDRRLQEIYDKVAALSPAPIDVLAIELIRGRMAHQHLTWSVGVSIAAARAPTTIEVPIRVWQAVTKTNVLYEKGDAADAAAIGQALILLANQHP